jgi:uncharacterized membrane protein SpoIIM required for sporulation
MIYSTFAIFLSIWIFQEQSSFVMVFFTVLACVPLIYNIMKEEEDKDLHIRSEKKLILEHNKAIFVLSSLFLGIMLSCVFWYVVLPSNTTGHLFQQQVNTISDINNHASGKLTGFATKSDVFFRIFFNNTKVLIFCVIFAFIYGAGAIFILTWNATVIAAAIGNFIRSNLATVSALAGLDKIAAYFTVVSTGLLRYSIHGIPEILAYFYAAVAGGIISVAVMNKHFSTDKANTIILDIGELVLIALGFLLVAAIFEVFVTPVIF